MPAMLAADMEAINKYFMETAVVKTEAAEKIKQEWMRWWADHRRSITWYSTEEFDFARNLRNKFNLANTTNTKEKKEEQARQARALTSEETRGETRRAGTSGMYLEEEKPLIPTSWKVGAAVGVGLVTLGVFGKQILKMTPAGKLLKFLS